MNGGEALVETLAAHGVDTVFCVPGESYLAVLEALRRRSNTMRLVTNRHESGATFAANAYGKLAHKPGIIGHGAGGHRRVLRDAIRVENAARAAVTAALNELLAVEVVLKRSRVRSERMLQEADD